LVFKILFVAWSGLFILEFKSLIKSVQTKQQTEFLKPTFTIISDITPNFNSPSQETEENLTPTRHVENVLQERNAQVLDGTTVKNR
jgi:hypothetical protein